MSFIENYRELYEAYHANSPERLAGAISKALACTHASSDEYYNMALILARLDYFDGVILLYRRLLAGDPSYQKARRALAGTLHKLGRDHEALSEYQEATIRDPHDMQALFSERLYLPCAYASEEERQQWRQRWRSNLKELIRTLSLSTPEEVQRLYQAAINTSVFLLAYQGDDVLYDELLYGELISRIVQARFPLYTERKGRKRRERLRVGFVSAFFHFHSIFKTHGGWITKLDRSRFEVYTFSVSSIEDSCTKELERHSDHFIRVNKGTDMLVDEIARSDLDVLIYPDVGMYTAVQPLAALRLARWQCIAIGHPVTSGLKTVDYVLSSELMEPADGQSQYCETVIRLPNLSSSYSLPNRSMAITYKEKDPQKTVYLNLQNPQKLLPRHDEIYPQLVQRVPNAEIHFFSATVMPGALVIFQKRLERLFQSYGLDMHKHTVFHPIMPTEKFFGLLEYGDIVLDSLDWSGFNSTMEAIAFDKPVVSMPGASCRSRHSYAILTMLGCPELIARSREEYLDIAASLSDPEVRRVVTQKIKSCKMRLYDDPAPIKALEEFLLSLD